MDNLNIDKAAVIVSLDKNKEVHQVMLSDTEMKIVISLIKTLHKNKIKISQEKLESVTLN